MRAQAQVGLESPEPTPEPEAARIEANKARIRATVNPTSEVDTAKVTPAQEKDRPIPSIEVHGEDNSKSSDEESSDEEDSNEKTEPTEKAKQAIDLILRSKKDNFWRILGVEEGSQDKIKTTNAFKELGCILHPTYVNGTDTEKAFNSA